MSETYLYCRHMAEVNPDFECCSSCHEEWESGYSNPMIMELEKNVYVEHCCGRNSRIPTEKQMKKYYRDKAGNR